MGIFNHNKQEIKNRANQILNGLNEEDIVFRAKKYKKENCIFNGILSGLGFLLFLVYICILLIYHKKIVIDDIFVICCSLIAAILPLVFLILTIKKSDIKLAKLSIERELYNSNGKIVHLNNELMQDFKIDRDIKILNKGFVSEHLLIDNENKKFVFKKGKNFSNIYNFSDILNYEVYENGTSRVKGTAGKALIGGAFFGLGGMVVGSSMGRNVEEKCNQLKLLIRINDLITPQICITYIENTECYKSSITYKNLRNNLQEVCSILEFIINSKTIEESKIENVDIKDKSNKEQLIELKEMLEEGLITREEFDQKKKQILGL